MTEWLTFTFHFHALEKEMATHSSVLAWRIPWTEEPGKLQSMGSQRIRHEWATKHTTPHTHLLESYVIDELLIRKCFWYICTMANENGSNMWRWKWRITIMLGIKVVEKERLQSLICKNLWVTYLEGRRRRLKKRRGGDENRGEKRSKCERKFIYKSRK